MSGHSKPPDSSPEGPESPSGKDSPDPPNMFESRDLKSPRQDAYLHHTNPSVSDGMLPMPPPSHDIPPPMPYADDGRMMQQPFAFPPLMMPPQQIDEQIPTDLRVMPPKVNPCACGTEMEEPQNLAYRQQAQVAKRDTKENTDSDSDTEIDLTSHSSRDDDLRESERLANRIATSIFRSDTVLHDLVPNDLSVGAIKNTDRNMNKDMSM